MPILHVVMPVFNEGPTLGLILSRVLGAPLPPGWSLDVTMIDDGSHAAAASAVQSAAQAADRERVSLAVHPRNRGKGAALLTGFDAVLSRASDTGAVLVQDADLEYDPADYPALLAALDTGGRKAVFGNRWAGDVHRKGSYRRVHAAANRLLTLFSNALTGLRVNDMECCYKLVPVPLLREIRPWLSEERFGIEPQIAAALARAGAQVNEVPVRYEPRSFAEGKKIRWNDGAHAFWVMLRERFRRTPPAHADRANHTDLPGSKQ